jgi:hypothetical protein
MSQSGLQTGRRHLVNVQGVDVRRVVSHANLTSDKMIVPRSDCNWSVLYSDCRKPSEMAAQQSQLGIAPDSENLPNFDPLKGPFSAAAAAYSPWAQSLDFLRDISKVKITGTALSPAWLKTWCETPVPGSENLVERLTHAQTEQSTKTQRLIWRSKRVVNCLVYGLPLLDQFDENTQQRFWNHLLTDVVRLGAPTDTFWQSLVSGFHPLSPRALWLRAYAIVCFDAAFKGFLLADLVQKSAYHLDQAIEKDGIMSGGSIMATLSAGADLALIANSPQVARPLGRIRQALTTLTHDSGNLVMLGEGAGEYQELLHALIGAKSAQRSAVLSSAGIAHARVENSNLWLRAPQEASIWAGICDLETDGTSLLENQAQIKSAMKFDSPLHVLSSKTKRRDEQDVVILETSATIALRGSEFHLCREMRISQQGRAIACEDSISSTGVPIFQPLVAICFALPQSCQFSVAQDGHSILILRANKSAWRLRTQFMTPSLVSIRSEEKKCNLDTTTNFIECKPESDWRKNTIRTIWTLIKEDPQ